MLHTVYTCDEIRIEKQYDNSRHVVKLIQDSKVIKSIDNCDSKLEIENGHITLEHHRNTTITITSESTLKAEVAYGGEGEANERISVICDREKT
jgi:hypothetical protein